MSDSVYVIMFYDTISDSPYVTGVFDKKEDADNAIEKEVESYSCNYRWSLFITSKNKISNPVYLYTKRGTKGLCF